ncbi:putative F-box domain, FBD domain, leucine-rich repeat domain superfamily [Helianthus annuus]|nr:putative F-box domain, FBD domain, leucine-rich repeat domain superfamily [Helianthus annuus]
MSKVLLNVMTDNHHKRRRFLTSNADDDDIISNFPEDLINPILERLPVKDAVRTSVLSKRWRYRWTTMRKLDLIHGFSGQFLKIGAFSCHGFTRVISQIMIHHQGPILTFLLHIPKEIVLDSFQEVDQWMLILSRNNVRKITIVNLNLIYQIPYSVFSCLELRTLGLNKCIFKPPLAFKGFPNLQVIILTNVNFGVNLGGTVINLPQLKGLILCGCGNVNNFNIKAENLQNLRVTSCPDANAMVLQLLHSEHLNAVYICHLSKSIKDIFQAKRFSFTIDGYFLKILAAEKFSNSLPHVVQCLQELEFTSFSFGDLNQLQGALCMLRNSPNLKGLRVTHMLMGQEADLQLTSNYLESPDCLDQTLLMLQTVEITSLEGSRPELLFVKLMLDCCPHLENMIIQPQATTDAEKRLNIAKDVLMFPRASPKAKVVFLDPEP